MSKNWARIFLSQFPFSNLAQFPFFSPYFFYKRLKKTQFRYLIFSGWPVFAGIRRIYAIRIARVVGPNFPCSRIASWNPVSVRPLATESLKDVDWLEGRTTTLKLTSSVFVPALRTEATLWIPLVPSSLRPPFLQVYFYLFWSIYTLVFVPRKKYTYIHISLWFLIFSNVHFFNFPMT